MAIDRTNLKQVERETEAYKAFMKIAKKVSYLEYGKWTIVPDPADPLRKFTLNKDFGWATVKLGVYMKDIYKRQGTYEDRCEFRGQISYSGLYRTKDGVDLKMVSSLRVRPRLAKDLIEQVNTNIIPNFYKDVLAENDTRMKAIQDMADFMREISLVRGLKQGVRKETYREPSAELKGCPLDLKLQRGFVEVGGRLSYMQLKAIAEKCGWGI